VGGSGRRESVGGGAGGVGGAPAAQQPGADRSAAERQALVSERNETCVPE
jgi:hypothetical protein